MPAPKERLHIPPPSGFGPLPFSNGVLAGDTFYLGGHIGIDPATKEVPDDLEREIRFLMESIQHTLAQAGLALQDLVSVQVFCSDVSLFDLFNSVYATFFTEPFPARAFLGSGTLLLDAHFEIQGIAIKP
jgi:2-iminobutanoate/2-iminopropanoate deaminase